MTAGGALCFSQSQEARWLRASTLTVTFLIPVFGILWGTLFLGEHIGGNTVMGAFIILLGTALVTGFNPLPNRK